MTEQALSLIEKVERLSRPISDSSTVGRSLIYDVVFDSIMAMRNSEEDQLPQGIWQRPLKKVDWNKIEQSCVKALEEQSKDLQIVAVLAETWMILYGLEGLNAGFKLLYNLCEKFWIDLYPRPREDDWEFRAAPFEWLSDKILIHLRLYPITNPPLDREKKYSFLDWKVATQKINAKPKAHEEQISLDIFNASRDATSSEFYQLLKQQAQQNIQSIENFRKLVGQYHPLFVGIFHRLRDQLNEMIGFIDITLINRGIDASKELQTVASSKEKSKAIPQENLQKVNQMKDYESQNPSIKSREQAYALLDQVATYLSTIEPHSPTPLLIRRAIAWGNMSLAEVLQELIHDKNDLIKIQNLLGLPKSFDNL